MRIKPPIAALVSVALGLSLCVAARADGPATRPTIQPTTSPATKPTAAPAAKLTTRPTVPPLKLPPSEPLSPPETRSAFLKLIDRPRVDPAVEVDSGNPDEKDPALNVFGFFFNSEKDQRVPGLLVKAAEGKAKRPIVIVMHGTGGSKDSQLQELRRFARAGFVAVAIDGRYHGKRAGEAGGTKLYNQAIAHAFEENKTPHDGATHPFYFDTVWDACRLIDYLQTRDDIDGSRIGLMGISKGGIETWLTAAVDERVSVAIPCIGVQSFAYALEHDLWYGRVETVAAAFKASAKSVGADAPDAVFVREFYDRVIPGIYSRFDGPQMLTAICPRPLMVINGDSDDKTPVEGVKLAAAAAEKAFQSAGAAEKFELIIEKDTAHKVTGESMKRAEAWFVRWLKP